VNPQGPLADGDHPIGAVDLVRPFERGAQQAVRPQHRLDVAGVEGNDQDRVGHPGAQISGGTA